MDFAPGRMLQRHLLLHEKLTHRVTNSKKENHAPNYFVLCILDLLVLTQLGNIIYAIAIHILFILHGVPHKIERAFRIE
jgi:hypothetical protein